MWEVGIVRQLIPEDLLRRRRASLPGCAVARVRATVRAWGGGLQLWWHKSLALEEDYHEKGMPSTSC